MQTGTRAIFVAAAVAVAVRVVCRLMRVTRSVWVSFAWNRTRGAGAGDGRSGELWAGTVLGDPPPPTRAGQKPRLVRVSLHCGD
jgi:hypothetical protein